MIFTDSFFFELRAFAPGGWIYWLIFTLMGVGINLVFFITKEKFKKYFLILFSLWVISHMYGYFFLITADIVTSWWPYILGYCPALLFFYMTIGFSLAQLLKNLKQKNTK